MSLFATSTWRLSCTLGSLLDAAWKTPSTVDILRRACRSRCHVVTQNVRADCAFRQHACRRVEAFVPCAPLLPGVSVRPTADGRPTHKRRLLDNHSGDGAHLHRQQTGEGEPSARRLGLAGGATTQLPNEVLEPMICDIGVPPGRDVSPSLAGCLLQELELGFLDALALFDEAQPSRSTSLAF